MPTIKLPTTVFLDPLFSDAISFVINGVVVQGVGLFDEIYDALDPAAENAELSVTVSRAAANEISHGVQLLIPSRDRGFRVIGKRPMDDGDFVDLILEEIGSFALPVTDILVPQTSGLNVIQLSDLRVVVLRGD